MREISLPHQWKPRSYQEPLWKYLSSGGKRAVALWHRRAGKDDVCLHHSACGAFERVGNYWHMLPEYSQARKAIWEAVNPHTGKRRIDEAFPDEIRASTREHEMFIKFKNGSTWQLVGSDNFNSLMGSPPLGITFSEYALSNPSSWGYLRPILLENNGWALFISTPRGNNHFKSMCDHAKSDSSWFFESLTAEQTGVFTQSQLLDELKELQSIHGEDYGKSLWLQEYYVSFDAAIPGSIWGDCVIKAKTEGRVCKVDPVKDYPVNTAWDLGYTDDTTIWFYQITPSEIRIFDTYHASGKDIDHYASILREKQKEFGYEYGTHWFPHDARPRTLASGGKSILQQFQNQNVGRCVIGPRLDREEGIQAARATFPYCRFDEKRCEKGLEALKGYHREWDSEKKVFSVNPVHSWESHYADAFRYLSLTWKRPKTKNPEEPLMERLLRNNPTGVTFGEYKKNHLNKRQNEREISL